MQYLPQILLSISLIPASVAAIFKVGKVSNTYLPFMIFLWAGTLTEVVVILYSRANEPHHTITNWYMLVETISLLWLFWNWDEKGRRKNIYRCIGFLLMSAWITETYLIHKGKQFISWYIVAESVIIGLLALEHIAGQVVRSKAGFKNADFLICLGLVLFSFTSAIIELFWLYGLNQTQEFQVKVYDVQGIINAFSNTLYFISVLWMQLKLRYTMQW